MLKYRSYTAANIHELPQYRALSDEQIHTIKTVATVYPFRINNHVAENLIDWSAVPDDPVFRLSFPQAGMLQDKEFNDLSGLIRSGKDKTIIQRTARQIMLRQNPNPAGQMELNTPQLDGIALHGMQHKYRESVLFFPSEAQVCHAYCTYCFRWPQFSGLDNLKFANHDVSRLISYLKEHPEVKDIIFTGGDPMVMSSQLLRKYIEPLLKIPAIRTIRIGTKSLSWWPYRFTTDTDADDILRLFEKIVHAGKHLAIMAHISHPGEIENPAALDAITRIRSTGAVIRSQSPIVRYINDNAQTWEAMWQKQLHLGIIPYYMFLERDTGPKHYFDVPLHEALNIFNTAYRKMSGLGRTVRGPSMSCSPGKIIVEDITEIDEKKVFVLKFTQSRDPEWTNQLFFAEYDESASWIDDLKPAFGSNKFFFEEEMTEMMRA
ncbi:MAG: lysine 2,3-aminomutase [Prosthecochloris sp.]|uniref:Radical SAM domain protein n=1 Tax=Prosthecochloris aestuarii (strain DSM 271 / SK 413) TaxID=290512 RepID=B4S805_PROA2|nr:MULTISPECIES: lysine 2,3-aminomutase [Prosthecochloris]ACF46192.1 radical SAM domain protein [Prosthecochloris aestuarii DSM 271]MCW8797998.1 lysine 2,3-aminomutase [Prosthecochloris sp.]NEX11917.1 lysine 2,3-aminomutase [Prosthecochloris sp.]